MIDVDKIREDFPILQTKMNGKPLIYLDSAATSQKPKQVIDGVAEFYRTKNANVARGLYPLAEEATRAYEEARVKVQKFLNAKSEKEIILCSNTTTAENIIMWGWGNQNIQKGDKIVTTILEHHSNFVPWQQLAKMKGASFEIMDVNDDCTIKEEELEKIKGAKLVAFSHVSNVAGTINDAKKICKLAKDVGAVTVVDGAQSIPSMPVDVQDIDCDFILFSGHKMLAPFGSGGFYGKQELLEKMTPGFFGSEMIREVHPDRSVWNDLPHKFEPGTPNVAEAHGLGIAIDYISKIGMENVRKHEKEMAAYALEKMQEIEGLRILGPLDAEKRGGLVAFELKGVHPHDVAAFLGDCGIAVRSGHHCAMPLHVRLDIPASSRASFQIYTKKEEIDEFVDCLKKVKQVFGG